MRTGRKDDAGKPRYDLLPATSVQEVVQVLTHGAAKYGPENWKQIQDLHNRYYAAAQRHIQAHRLGVKRDEETGLHHLAHAICSLIFIMETELKDGE